MYFLNIDSFEKSVLKCCQPCKTICQHLVQTKETLSTLIDDIHSLLNRSKQVCSYLLSKPQVLTKLFQPPNPSSFNLPAKYIDAHHFPKTEDSVAGIVNKTPKSSDPKASSSSSIKIPKSIIPSDSIVDNPEDLDSITISKDELGCSSSDFPKISTSQVPPRPGKHICDICEKPFKHLRDLENHIGYHKQDKPFICEICGVGYRQKRGLESHVALHKGEALFKCDHCNKVFTQKSGLQRHLPIHSGETVFQCDICGKGFMYHSSFAHHKRIHAGERKYNCGLCNQSFLSSSHLKRHNKLHTGMLLF